MDKFMLVKTPNPPRAREASELKLNEGIIAPVLGTFAKGAGKRVTKLDLPPVLEITTNIRHTFRFSSNAGGSSVVTPSQLIGALGTVCTVTNSTVRPFCSSFRINKIRVWESTSAGAALSFGIFWNAATGIQQRDEEKNRSIPEGVFVTGVLETRPPKGTLAALWQTANSNALFGMNYNVGTILDLDVSFTLSNQFISGTQTVATGVLGNIYYLYLDGSTSHVWTPVGLPSTF